MDNTFLFRQSLCVLFVARAVSFAQPVGVDYNAVNKVTIDYYESIIKAGDWSNGLPYFDAHSPLDENSAPKALADETDAIAWERYLFTAGDVHLNRSAMFKKPEVIHPHAKKAEDAYLAYIAWYSELKLPPPAGDGTLPAASSKYPLGWLPEVKATRGQNDPPITRGRIRHVLSQLVESILTQGDPKRAAEALKTYDSLWLGDDAIRKWIKALGYRFSDAAPEKPSDLEKVRANLDRPGWREVVAAFVEKLDDIEKKRIEIKAPPLDKGWIKLRDQLRTAPPK